jgi:prolyl-tRNA editing enzyme YbaK/EbsC (Cys-tRNA(Pro) deacylase)
MSIDKVRTYFKGHNIEERIIEFDVSSATVELAARALSCEEARIAKSMSFMTSDGPIIIVCAGDTKVNNKKFKQTFNAKASMISPDRLGELVGHEMGGVCPFAIREGVRVFLDESLKRFDTVFPACGSSNSAIELTIPELEKYSNFTSWVDVTITKE